MWRTMETKSSIFQRAGAQESKSSDVQNRAPSVTNSADTPAIEEQPEQHSNVLEDIAKSEQEIQLPSFSRLEDDGDDDDDGMGEFNEILLSVARIRDAAMNGSLTDEERRKKAAEMALKLAHTLGIDMDESDLEEEDDV